MPGHNELYELDNAPYAIKDPGNAGVLPRDQSGIVNIVTTGAETRTLAVPVKEGVTLTLNFLTDGGDCVITVAAAFDEAGTTTITLADAGDYITLRSMRFGSAFRWRYVSSNGIVVPTFDQVLEDDASLGFGAPDVKVLWETADANANELIVVMPTGTSTNVPAIVIAQGIENFDLGLYNGITEPRVAIFGSGAVTTGPVFEFRKSRGTNIAPTVVTSGDDLGYINAFAAVAAGEYVQSAQILFECTGTVATTRGPGVITIKTATDAAPSVLTSALVIGANQVVVPQSGFTPKSLSAAAITTTRALTAQDSGGIFSIAKTSAYAITLPTPAQGLKFKFLVLDTGANIVTISDGSAHLFGVVSVNNTNVAMTGTTLSLASGNSVGDWVEFEGIDSTHYLVTGACIAAADITIA